MTTETDCVFAKLTEDMHMIGNAAHNQCWALEIFQNRG